MTEPKAAILALTTALLIPQGVGAQVESRLEAGALVTESREQSALPANIFRLTPSIAFDHPNARISANGSAWVQHQQWQIADGIVSGTLISPTIYGVRAEVIGNASRAFDDRALGSDQLDLQTRVHVLFKKRGGVWVGGGVARPWRVAVVSSVDVTNAGAWTQLGGATLSTTLTNFHFTKTGESASGSETCTAGPLETSLGVTEPRLGPAYSVAAPGDACHYQSRVSDLEGGVRWDLDRFQIAGQWGMRFGSDMEVGPDSRQWGTASLTMWVAPRVAFVAGGGRQPANLSRGFPAHSFGSVGMVIAYLPSPRGTVPVAPARAKAMVRYFDVSSGPPGMQKVTVRVGGVESVDVMGDFTDWSPVTLTRRGRDTWELLLPMDVGVHHINIRIDGGPWIAPPGLPSIRDGFNGEIGVLVVKNRDG